jgi:hypothetical protein
MCPLRLGLSGSLLGLPEDAELSLLYWALCGNFGPIDLSEAREAIGQSPQRWRRTLSSVHDIADRLGHRFIVGESGTSLSWAEPPPGPIEVRPALRPALLLALPGPRGWHDRVELAPLLSRIGLDLEGYRSSHERWLIAIARLSGLAYLTDGAAAAFAVTGWPTSPALPFFTGKACAARGS